VLNEGWDVIRDRVNSVFEETMPADEAAIDPRGEQSTPSESGAAKTRVNERRVWGTSITFGVVGAFALAGMLAHQMEGFQSNVKGYIESQQTLIAQHEAAGGTVYSFLK
jgi:hypothetical protein